MMTTLLDTCVLIDLMRRNASAERAVAAFAETPSVCAVSVMELHAGARSQREESDIDRLIGCFRTVSVDADVFRRAGTFMRHYRASHGTDTGDALIAATAEHHGLKLVTLNVKHFPMFKRLKRAY